MQLRLEFSHLNSLSIREQKQAVVCEKSRPMTWKEGVQFLYEYILIASKPETRKF